MSISSDRGPFRAKFERCGLRVTAETKQCVAERRCGSEGCGADAYQEFVSGDVGTWYCVSCYAKVMALAEKHSAPVPAQVTAETKRRHRWCVAADTRCPASCPTVAVDNFGQPYQGCSLMRIKSKEELGIR